MPVHFHHLVQAADIADKNIARGPKTQQHFAKRQVLRPIQLRIGNIYQSWFKLTPKAKPILEGEFQLLAVDMLGEDLIINVVSGEKLLKDYPLLENTIALADVSLWPYKPEGTWHDSRYICFSGAPNYGFPKESYSALTTCEKCSFGAVGIECSECSTHPYLPEALKNRRLIKKYIGYDTYGYFACPYCEEKVRHMVVCSNCQGREKVYGVPKTILCDNCRGHGDFLGVLCQYCFGFGGRLTYLSDGPMTNVAVIVQKEIEVKKLIDFDKLESLYSTRD